MTVGSRDGRRRGWVTCGCLALGAAVVIPVVVWIVRDLSTAANVAEVVSIPLTAVSLLLGLVAARSGRDHSAGDGPGSGEQPFWDRVRRWATLVPIRQRCGSVISRRRVRRIMAIVAVGGLLTAGGLVGWDRVVGNQPGADLLARVPEPLREHCVQADAPVGIGASVTLNCQYVSGQEVVISLFGTEPTMDEAYGEIVRQTGIPRGSGDCAITTGAEHRYPGIGTPTGRALCYQQDGNAVLVWTNDEQRTVAGARRRDGNDIELYRFWASLVGVPSFTPDEKELLSITEEEETDCRRAPAGSLDRFPAVVAAVECEAGDAGADTVSFYRFADLDALQRSYQAQVRDVQAKTGACVDGEAPGFLGEEGWNIRNVELGRILCYPGQQGELVMEWTVEPMRLLVRAVGTDPTALSDWWKEDSGPADDAIVQAVNTQAQPPFPTVAEQELLDHLPGPSRVECMRLSAERVSEDVSGMPVAAIVCGTTNDGPDQVRYYQFPDSASMTVSYGGEAFPGPDCNSEPPDFTGQAEYSRNGTVMGRLACATNDAGFPYLVWTHDRLNILALAFKDQDPAPLLDWWHAEAGPV